MKKTDKIKQAMKESYAKKVDKYFSQFEELSENEKLNINEIETLLGKGITDIQEVLLETTEELLKAEPEEQEGKKKHVRPAKKH